MSVTLSAGQLQDLLVKLLVKRTGGSPRHWRLAVGSIQLHDAATHPHCNWSLRPAGSSADIATIESLLDDVRMEHPIVRA